MRRWIAIAAACAATASVGAWAAGSLPWQDAGASKRQGHGAAAAPQVVSGVSDESALRASTPGIARMEARRRRQAGLTTVGDADAFGRPLRWMGLASTPKLDVRDDCTGPDGAPLALCLQTVNGSGYGEYRDLAHITLPGGSAHSLLCHWQSQTVGASFFNSNPYPQDLALAVYPSVTVESEVLAGLPLTNPDTRQPMDGTLEIWTSPTRISATLGQGEVANRESADTRACVGGLINRRNLRDYYGLSDAQITQLFAAPMTLRLNMAVVAAGTYGAAVSYGIRFVGD